MIKREMYLAQLWTLEDVVDIGVWPERDVATQNAEAYRSRRPQLAKYDIIVEPITVHLPDSHD